LTHFEEITQKGVPCFSGSCSEIYLEKAFENTGFRPKERFPAAKKLGETSLMFLVHPTLTQEEIDKTCNIITVVLNKVSESAECKDYRMGKHHHLRKKQDIITCF